MSAKSSISHSQVVGDGRSLSASPNPNKLLNCCPPHIATTSHSSMNKSNINLLAEAAEAMAKLSKAPERKTFDLQHPQAAGQPGIADHMPFSSNSSYHHVSLNLNPSGVGQLTNSSSTKNNGNDEGIQVPHASSVICKSRDNNFAKKLHAILADKNCKSAIAWLPSGKAVCILNKVEFTNKILPMYFRETKFDSFTRRLKRWGFRKVSANGASQVVFSHDHFQKDRIDLCEMMNGRAGGVRTKEIKGIQDSIELTEQVETASAATSAIDRNVHTKKATDEIAEARKSLQANRSIMAVGCAQVQRNAFLNQGMHDQATNPLLNQVSYGSLSDTSRIDMNMDIVYAQVQRNEFINQGMCQGQLQSGTNLLFNQVPVGCLGDRFALTMPYSYRQLGSPHPTAMTNFQPEANHLASNERFSLLGRKVHNGMCDMNVVMNQSLLPEQEIAEHGRKQLELLHRLNALRTMYPH